MSQQDPKKELKIELNRGLANSMGISSNDAAQALRVAFAGIEVGDWVDPTGETRDVAVRLHPDDRISKENIERLPIAVSGTNRMVPLDQIATISMGKGPSGIEHNKGKRTITVSANVQGRSNGEVIAEAKNWLNRSTTHLVMAWRLLALVRIRKKYLARWQLPSCPVSV